jgi:hypothetical protein
MNGTKCEGDHTTSQTNHIVGHRKVGSGEVHEEFSGVVDSEGSRTHYPCNCRQSMSGGLALHLNYQISFGTGSRA